MKRLQIERPLLIVTVSILTSCNGGTGGRFPETSGNIPGPAATASTPGSEDGQWLTPAKDYASTRFSQLDQLTTSNVSSLKPAWSFSTGLNRGHEAAPIVVKDTMYITTPFPNYLYALDLNKPGTMKWVYKPGPSPSAQGVACCDVVNRGAAYYNGRIYYNTLDNHTVAVDAITGKEVWKTLLGDINKGESMTMAPLVAKGRVFVGNSGGEFGIRGWLSGLDADSGKIIWRGYCCGPDRDVLIGPNFKPFYQADRQANLGQTTWPNDLWKIGGGGARGWISYNPELDLIYYGTSNPGPWNSEQRPGDNKWTASIFARRPDTGEAIWAYQYSPHDTFDYDAVNENVLLDLNIKGKVRKTLIHPDRNGFMYVIDRQTGEVISAGTYGYTNTATGVDLKTGRPQMVHKKRRGLAESCATSARLHRVPKTGSPWRTRSTPACSTSRTITCAWKRRAWRRTTLRERRTSEPTFVCTDDVSFRGADNAGLWHLPGASDARHS